MKRARNMSSGLIIVAVGVILFLFPAGYNSLQLGFAAAVGLPIYFVMAQGSAAVFKVVGGLVVAVGLYVTFRLLPQSFADIEAAATRTTAAPARSDDMPVQDGVAPRTLVSAKAGQES